MGGAIAPWVPPQHCWSFCWGHPSSVHLWQLRGWRLQSGGPPLVVFPAEALLMVSVCVISGCCYCEHYHGIYARWEETLHIPR